MLLTYFISRHGFYLRKDGTFTEVVKERIHFQVFHFRKCMSVTPQIRTHCDIGIIFSGTSLRRTSLGPTKLSITERVSSGQGFIIHYGVIFGIQ